MSLSKNKNDSELGDRNIVILDQTSTNFNNDIRTV